MREGKATLRQGLGCWLNERWRAEFVLRSPHLARAMGLSWLDLRNRNERLQKDESSRGRICLWSDSSRYTGSRIFPDLAPRLLRHVLTEWPLKVSAVSSKAKAVTPIVSIVIPIGGKERMIQFELALEAARSQSAVDTEVIVVEQSRQSTLAGRLPSDVRYLHQPAEGEGRFNKSQALNAGARIARGDSLIILDGDYLLPQSFASECARVLRSKEAARPARWIFYLDEGSTLALSQSRDPDRIVGIEAIVSNNPTPIAVRRDTYWAIGGHDESYVGWGGEDTEFLDRLRTRDISEGGWMPVLHAWHPAAAKKADGDRNAGQHRRIMGLSATQRIERLGNVAATPGNR